MMGKRVVTLRSELFIGSITAKSYRVMMLYCFQEKHHVKKKKTKNKKIYHIVYLQSECNLWINNICPGCGVIFYQCPQYSVGFHWCGLSLSIHCFASVSFQLQDLDKSQEEIKKHHASISELKKNFMESVPEPRPSEWDKRLSTHSPFRTLNINGQIPTGEGVSTLCDEL